MAESRCPECGAIAPIEDAHFCHGCGSPLPRPEARAVPAPPPVEPPEAESAARRRRSGLLGPLAVAAAGIALLVAGAVSSGDDGSDMRSADPLRASGALDVPAPEEFDPEPAPAGTVADFSVDRTGTPNTTTATMPPLSDWTVALSESFTGEEMDWPIGSSGSTTRAVVDGRYQVATDAGDQAKLVFTWRTDLQPPVWFRLRVDAAGPGDDGAACGLAIAAADGYPRVAVVVDDAAQRYGALARETADADLEVLIAWTDLPDLILPDQSNPVELIGRDDGIFLLLGDLAVAVLPRPTFTIARFGMVLRAPAGSTQATCEFDDLLVSWP